MLMIDGWAFHAARGRPMPPHDSAPPTVDATAVVRLLGPVGVVCRTGFHSLDGPRTGPMMAALALRANRPVPVSFLVEAAWGQDPPKTYREQVHNCVGRLRRLLVAHVGEVNLARVSDGYQLGIDAERIDVNLFQRDVLRAREAATRGDLAGAVAAIRQSLNHWYGDALDGVSHGALAASAAALDDMRLAAYEELFAYEFGLGNHASVVSELATLADRHYVRERLVQQLMTALRHAGRSVEALRVYREHRRRMIDEMGVEPDRALRELQIDILRGQSDLDGPGPTGLPTFVPGRGEQVDPAVLLAHLSELALGVAALAEQLRRQTCAG
jgi:DNA-binding SARP family transcriptional activator